MRNLIKKIALALSILIGFYVLAGPAILSVSGMIYLGISIDIKNSHIILMVIFNSSVLLVLLFSSVLGVYLLEKYVDFISRFGL